MIQETLNGLPFKTSLETDGAGNPVFGNREIQLLAVKNAITSVTKITSLMNWPYDNFSL
ncbi:hypothetical protein [Anoxynatronum sibiricum]|uniref:hypothetical protein n=1 Tax=Anoxynatronum sibiricum TaxID=210623 RepID=UPI0031B81585